MNLKNLWERILRFFGINKVTVTIKEQTQNAEAAAEYEDAAEINFTAIFSNKLANLTVEDSSVSIPEDNKRAELMREILDSLWERIKKITARSFGTGGVLIVPSVQGGELKYDIVSQERLCINNTDGDKITAATILAETKRINNKLYMHFIDYTVQGGTLTIRNKTVDGSGSTAALEEWSIPDMAITNVDRCPFGYIKSPVDNRKNTDRYGVPITYGCDDTIEQLKELLKQYRKEFALKRTRVQADERAFDKDKDGKPVIKDDLFIAGYNATNDNMFNIFDPAFRDVSYSNRFKVLCELLEKQVGTSRGILTYPDNSYENIEKIREANRGTWAIISDMRKAVEKGLNDFFYACDVLINYYGLAPQGGWSLVPDWSYSLIESTEQTWQQLKEGQSIGIRSKAELRSWQTGESLEEAQEKIDEITASEPSLGSLIGASNA